MDAVELFDAPFVVFTEPIPMQGPKTEAQVLKRYFGENLEYISGVVQLATGNLKRLPEKKAILDAIGYIHYPKAKLALPEMMDRGREVFPKAQNFIFIIDRPAELKGKSDVLPGDDFHKMMSSWVGYAKRNKQPIIIKAFLGNPSSEHVLDIRVVMNAKTETDGIYGLHSYGMGAFIPLDEHTPVMEDTPEGVGEMPPQLLQFLKMLAESQRRGGDVKIEPLDEIDAEYSRITGMRLLPDPDDKEGKGGKGKAH